MTTRTVAIRLKIPDNEAQTARNALQRLGVAAAHVERAEIWAIDDNGTAEDFVARVERNESLFNPNKHRLEVLPESRPRVGETWIAQRDETPRPLRIEGVAGGRRYVGWRLFDDARQPVSPDVIHAAAARLLCNPAIERAIYS